MATRPPSRSIGVILYVAILAYFVYVYFPKREKLAAPA